MSVLSQTDREALLANLVDDPMWIDSNGEPLDYLPRREELLGAHLDRQIATVEQIVARHVTATWNAAIAVVEKPLLDAPNPSAAFQLWTNVHAADLKVAATPKPPEVVRRPQPRGIGE